MRPPGYAPDEWEDCQECGGNNGGCSYCDGAGGWPRYTSRYDDDKNDLSSPSEPPT